MLISDLSEECALHIGDPNMAQVTKDMWLMFIKSAARDMAAAGWLIRANDDTSLVGIANTYVYTIPQRFAYIKELRSEDITGSTSVYTRMIPSSHWTIHKQAGVPVLFFFTISSIEVGRKLMIVGQQRPTVYATTADTVDPGTESFLRERAIAYGARYAGAGVSEMARWRQVIAGQSMQTSERTLRLLPQEFRVQPDGRVVPGRET